MTQPGQGLHRRQKFDSQPATQAPATTESTFGKWKVSLPSFDFLSYLTTRNIAIAAGVTGLVAAGFYFVPQLFLSVGTATMSRTNEVVARASATTGVSIVKEFVQPIVGTVQDAFLEAMRLAKFDMPIISPSAISCIKDLMPNITDMSQFKYPVSAFMNNTDGNSCLFMKLMNVASEKISTVVLYGQDNGWSFGNLLTNTSVHFRTNDVRAISTLWQGFAADLSGYPVDSEAVQHLYKLVIGPLT